MGRGPGIPSAGLTSLRRLRTIPAIIVVLTAIAVSLSALPSIAQPSGETGPGLTLDNQNHPGDSLWDNPISPPDTTSPRATLESFILIMREASRIWQGVRIEFAESGATFLTDDQEQRLELVNALIEKSSRTFDLSAIPVTARNKASVELALQFQEILDRIYVPDFETIPGAAAGAFLNSSLRDSLPQSWIIPGTDITISKVETGPRQGHFLVSGATVERIPTDYDVVKTFPLKVDRGEDIYEYYIYTAGDLVAPPWYALIQQGPEWLQNHYAGQAYWQWLAFGILTLSPLLFLLIWRKARRWRAVSISKTRRQIESLLAPTTIIVATLTYRYLCEAQINITGGLMQGISTVTTAILWTSVAWLTYRFMDLLYTWIIRNPALPTGSLDASLLRTAYRLFSLMIALSIAGYGATQIGIPIYGVIAGLGVGGLAIALAAQPTLENLIGGVILYADRMVRVGEFCKFDDLSGTIEAIGIRSTRIRALDRTVITIANSDLAKRKIVNFSHRDRFRLRHDIGLRYETTPDQMRDVLTRVRKFLEGHPQVMDESLRVRFKSLDDYALTVEVNGYVSASDFAEFLGIQEEILLYLIEIVKSSGSDFAFPSSTTYFARDTGLDQDLARQAEERAVEARAGNDPASVPEGFEADLFRQLRPHSDGIDRTKPSAA